MTIINYLSYFSYFSQVLVPKSNQPNKRQHVPANQKQRSVGHAVTSQKEKTNFSVTGCKQFKTYCEQNNDRLSTEAEHQMVGSHVLCYFS